jgi:AraC-like DNA-binding protein
MPTLLTTRGIVAAERSRHWHEAIARTYFPLDLQFRQPDRFRGELSIWQVGDVSLTRNTSDALLYRRLPRHFTEEREEQFLVTVPARAQVRFFQCGVEVRCNPGGFILERSHEPYEFSHAEAADLWVLKVDAKALGGRIRAPGRFCSMQFDASSGAGGLFVDMLQLLPARFESMSEEVRCTVGRQLTELLVLALRADPRALTSGSTSVREAHLTRIDTFVRRHLEDPELDPERIAAACGMSIRYLHELFRDTDLTVGQWIRRQRLEACRASLGDIASRESIATIAYRWGFAGQAQFSRAFKTQFGLSPKDFRERTRQAIAR